MKRYARFRSPGWLLSSYSSASGCFICRSGRVGLVAWPRTATRRYGNCEDGSPRHEQEVKENVLARPAADARQLPSLSLSLSLFLSLFPRASPSFHHVNLLSSIVRPARSLRHAPLDSSSIPPRSHFPSRASSCADPSSLTNLRTYPLSLSLSLSLCCSPVARRNRVTFVLPMDYKLFYGL